MKSFFKVIGIVGVSASLLCSCKGKQESTELNDLRDSASYCIGFVLGTNLAQQNMDSINLAAFNKGFQEAKTPDDFKINKEEINNIVNDFVLSVLRNQYSSQIEESENFLQTNGAKAGVTTTASGLQYEILQEGNGPKPNLYDTVVVKYEGKFLDGTIFDKTMDSEPARFALIPGYLIEGWIEAFPLLKEGTKAKIVVPYELGYGEGGFQSIPPFSTLVFDAELVKVIKGKAPEASQMPQFE